MEISMNNVGNYSPRMRTNTDVSQKYNVEVNNDVKAKTAVQQENTVTAEEKNYFMQLYPENKKEIVDYHFYQKSGKMSGVKVGSLIDRRG
jgi:hypothetical protein